MLTYTLCVCLLACVCICPRMTFVGFKDRRAVRGKLKGVRFVKVHTGLPTPNVPLRWTAYFWFRFLFLLADVRPAWIMTSSLPGAPGFKVVDELSANLSIGFKTFLHTPGRATLWPKPPTMAMVSGCKRATSG